MSAQMQTGSGINFDAWDMQEFDWTGKSFYFIPIINLFYRPIGLGSKLELLNREVRQGGYKIASNMILIQYCPFKGRAMIEVEKQDKYDAQVLTLETNATVDTMVFRGTYSQWGKGIKRLTERVAAKRGLAPRELYYMYVVGWEPGAYRTILFALT